MLRHAILLHMPLIIAAINGGLQMSKYIISKHEKRPKKGYSLADYFAFFVLFVLYSAFFLAMAVTLGGK